MPDPWLDQRHSDAFTDLTHRAVKPMGENEAMRQSDGLLYTVVGFYGIWKVHRDGYLLALFASTMRETSVMKDMSTLRVRDGVMTVTSGRPLLSAFNSPRVESCSTQRAFQITTVLWFCGLSGDRPRSG